MRDALLGLLADPEDGGPLEVAQEEREGGEVVSGTLRGRGGHTYPIVAGIPRFSEVDDAGQQQTRSSFAYKWAKRDSYGSEGMRRALHAWLLERYGFESPQAMREFFGSRAWILDAGCGAGFATSAWMDERWSRGAQWVGCDISTAVDVAQERLGGFPGTHFVQADVSRPPFRPGSFDVVFAEGVLHHTPSTRAAFDALVPLLAPGES